MDKNKNKFKYGPAKTQMNAKKRGGGALSCIILPIARIYVKQFVG